MCPLSRLERWFTAETQKKKKKKPDDGRDFLFSFLWGFIQTRKERKNTSFFSPFVWFFSLNFSYKGGERDNGRKPACITRLISACAQTPHFLTHKTAVNCVHTNKTHTHKKKRMKYFYFPFLFDVVPRLLFELTLGGVPRECRKQNKSLPIP